VALLSVPGASRGVCGWCASGAVCVPCASGGKTARSCCLVLLLLVLLLLEVVMWGSVQLLATCLQHFVGRVPQLA
jgi:hypothetical protein